MRPVVTEYDAFPFGSSGPDCLLEARTQRDCLDPRVFKRTVDKSNFMNKADP